MSVFTYAEDGERTPFNPFKMGAQLAGCLLCGGRVTAVGVFIPSTDDMRTVVLRLRQHPVPPHTTPCVAYGVCADHLVVADIPRI